MDHIKPLRLFDLSQADPKKPQSQLEQWEKDHLRECEECQQVLEVFARQFKPKRANDAK